MAMPRYRYAIGQAPVRFPSPAPSTADLDDKENSTPGLSNVQDSRLKRSSTSTESPYLQKRDQKLQARLQDDRRRTKSMYDGTDGTTGKLQPGPTTAQTPQTPTAPRLSPRASWSDVRAASPSTSSAKREERMGHATERTPLQATRDSDMVQRQSRPASASVSASIRPSSLFWTEHERAGEHRDARKATGQLARSSSSYGAIESAAGKHGEDDPYGYRALAGPALLPTFHQQQEEQQRQREAKDRTCGPFRVAVEKKGWLVITLAGLAEVVVGLWYLFA